MIIFDFDGVLADSRANCLAACVEAARGQGAELELSSDTFATLDPLTFEALADRHGLQPDQFAADVARAVSGFAMPSLIFDGIAEALTTLARDHALAVISASHSDVIRTVLAQQGLDQLMSRIIGGDTPGQKPGKIAALVATQPDEPHVMIGDASSDIQAARAAGIKAIAVAWGWQSPEHLMSFKPDALARNPNELVDLAQTLLKPMRPLS